MIGRTKLLLKLTLCSVLVTYGTASTMKTGNVLKSVVGTGDPTFAKFEGLVTMYPTEVCTPVFSSTTNKVTEYETITCINATTARVDKFSDAGCKTKTSSKVLTPHQAFWSTGPPAPPGMKVTFTCAMGVKTSGYAYRKMYSTAQCGATKICKSELYAAGICMPFTQKVAANQARSQKFSSKDGRVYFSDTNCKTPIGYDQRYRGVCLANDNKKDCKNGIIATSVSLGVTPYVATVASSTSPSACFGFLSLAAAAIVASMRA